MRSQTARLVLVCRDVPPAQHERQPTEFGLQDAHEVLHLGARQPDGALRFELEVRLKTRADGSPDFAGPFVHGPGGGRFVYLGWRPLGGSAWIRRYKIPLAGISWELIDAAGGGVLLAGVSAAERKATLTPSGGWAPLP